LEKQIIGYLQDLQIIDVASCKDTNNTQEIYFDDSKNALEIIRHSTAHLMAQAIDELYTNAKFFVGPNIEDGFYYDFRVDEKISDDDLSKIEKKMKELCKKGSLIEKSIMSKEEILKKFAHDEIKQEVIKNIQSDIFSTYKQGNFEDLCRGPHLPHTKMIFNFKLLKVTGAYLGGNEKNEMLTRIYGTAFATKEALKDYLHMIEESKKRDHRKLGGELGLFTFSEEVGAGLPIWLPNGATLRKTIEDMIYDLHIKKGYMPVRGPEILKSDLWKQSGHYENYGENIYKTVIDDKEYGIKPMNCLGHIKVYENTIRSYRELPLRFFEYGVVHRHEKSGVLHGLFRVREFTQDDSHIFCTKEQIKDVIGESLELIDSIMKYFNFDYSMEISTKPEKSIGSDEIWQKATDGLKEALNEKNLPYDIDDGGGAFYGPKIDIKITDALKRKWQCGTIQVDFNLPDRFELSFVNKENTKERPVMIHRAILGSFERFIGILIEHFAGEFPLAIAPTKAIIIPVNEVHFQYCKKIQQEMLKINAPTLIYNQNESLSKRVRIAEKQKVPIVIIIGDKEIQENSVAIRDRREKTQYDKNLDDFLQSITRTINERIL
jgi:threonyl-tRNA synthetase